MMMTTLDQVATLIAWLRKRGQPDSGIRYEQMSSYDGLARVELHGPDATFVADHFHSQGARDLADAVSSLSLGGWETVLWVSSKQMPDPVRGGYVAARTAPEGNFDTPLFAFKADQPKQVERLGANRQQIALIIDPHAFMSGEGDDELVIEIVRQSRDDALRKADRIIQALHGDRS